VDHFLVAIESITRVDARNSAAAAALSPPAMAFRTFLIACAGASATPFVLIAHPRLAGSLAACFVFAICPSFVRSFPRSIFFLGWAQEALNL